jgi:hypothetical protein
MWSWDHSAYLALIHGAEFEQRVRSQGFFEW